MILAHQVAITVNGRGMVILNETEPRGLSDAKNIQKKYIRQLQKAMVLVLILNVL